MKNVNEINEALINLTHVVVDKDTCRVSASHFVDHGIIFVNENGPVDKINDDVADLVVDEIGYNWSVWNNQFHKSWGKVADATIEQLVWEQIIHYFSTYGLESLGLTASPYIPVEDILPEDMRPGVDKFTIVKVVSEKEAINTIDNYLKNILKPNNLNLDYIKDFMSFTTVNAEELKSFELKCLFYAERSIVPSDGQDFLRYIVYITTGSSLIIKNNDLITRIKATIDSNNDNFSYSYDNYKNAGRYDKNIADKVNELFSKANLTELSKSFLRNKVLFLAYKTDKRNAPIINKIRRLAVDNHQPLSEVSVANVMNLISQKRTDDVLNVLKKTSNRNLIKLINFANTENENHIYNIRNGKVFVNEKPINKDNLKWLYKSALKQLALNLSGKQAGKKFYIPTGIDYKAPISEKQMIGAIPYGTTMTVDSDLNALCLSIAWENYKGTRTDIDLHLSSATASYGWNSGYRSSNGDVLYSGDMTDATNGATESFRFKIADEPYLASVNLYSGEPDVPFSIFLSGAENFRENERGCVEIDNALTTPIKLRFSPNCRALSLGFMQGKTFTVYGGSLGRDIVPKQEFYEKALDAIVSRCNSMLSLTDIIEFAGGTVVDTLDEGVVDLSPENLIETTIFEIIDGE